MVIAEQLTPLHTVITTVIMCPVPSAEKKGGDFDARCGRGCSTNLKVRRKERIGGFLPKGRKGEKRRRNNERWRQFC